MVRSFKSIAFVWQPKPKRCMIYVVEDSCFLGNQLDVHVPVECNAGHTGGATSTIEDIPNRLRTVATLLENRQRMLVLWAWEGSQGIKVEKVLNNNIYFFHKPAHGFEPRIFSLQVRCVATAPYGRYFSHVPITITIILNIHTQIHTLYPQHILLASSLS